MQDQAAVEVASVKWKALGLPTEILDAVVRNPQQPIRQTLPLASPIDGVVTHADLSIGKVVDPKEHLFEIIDLSTVWLKIGVLEKDLARVAVGQPVTFAVTSIPNHQFTGTVDAVDSFLDPETHLGIVWATLQNTTSDGTKLLPGMSGSVQVEQSSDSSNVQPNVIPLAAVIRDGAERFVLVEQEQTAAASTYQKQPVALGARSGDVIELRGGNLFPGDRVVTRGSHELGSFFAKGVLTVSPEAARDIDLKVQPVSRSSLSSVITIDGVIDVPPTHRSVASAQLGGSIQSILVDRGQKVRRGDVLAEINSQPLQNLQLELMKVSVDLDLQTRLVENIRSAVDAISKRRLWETESLVNQLTSRRDTIIMQLRTAGLNADQINGIVIRKELVRSLPVRAPIDGNIVGFDKFLGHVVRPDEPLFEVHDLSHAWVQGFISERDFPDIRVGQTVRVRLVTSPDEVLGGTIVRSGQSISDDDRTLSVWIELVDMPTFQVQHNMFARISIETGKTTEGLMAPRESIVHEGIRSYVFVESEDKSYERRLVETGITNDRSVQILSGLSVGESIAVSGASELQSGYAALK
jgi:RND family efflux transporter MFP subunit